jgi:hypothetical protein
MARTDKGATAPGNEFGRIFMNQITKMGMSIRQAAEKAMELKIRGKLTDSISYEQIRKIVRGTQAPTNWVLHILCAVADLDEKEMQEIVAKDRLMKQHGHVLEQMGKGISPDHQELITAYKDLRRDQKTEVLKQMQALARANRRSALEKSEKKRVTA